MGKMSFYSCTLIADFNTLIAQNCTVIQLPVTYSFYKYAATTFVIIALSI
jgi:hypothetical protein